MGRQIPGTRRAGRLARQGLVCAIALAFSSALPARGEDSWDNVARVVAVGDVHGDYDQLVWVLKDAGLLDGRLRWAGGKTHLVQTGDRLDRGAASRKVMDLLMRLEKEARKAGGQVHCLLGNHEAMNMQGDLGDVSPGEFAAFRGPDSRLRRDALWERIREKRRESGQPDPTDADRKAFEREIPLGWVEHRQAFSPEGKYGAWLANQNTVIRIGGTLFLHGGLSPKYADFSRADLNDRIRRELQAPDPLTDLVTRDPEGPLWHRLLARGDATLAAHLETVLQRQGVRRMVVGHTTTQGLVMPLYAGRVIAIHVGLARIYSGVPAALILEGEQAYALHRGHRVRLPEADGEPVLRYVREIAALEPSPERLNSLILELEAVLSPTPAR